MRSWNRLAQLPLRRVIGLMSGTSVDGIDAAMVEIEGCGPSLRLRSVVESDTVPFDPAIRERIHTLFDGHVADICEMNVILGELFAQAALQVIEKADLKPRHVHLIGSHGQTIYHVPRGGERTASSLQIGEPSVIAERTGITTVANFRPRDIAAGGEGAPLVPYVDWTLCRRENETIALQNIGGIANVTVVTPDINDLLAFDTGPGNMIIDAAVSLTTGGAETFDRDGRTAASTSPDRELANRLLSDPWLTLNPPKSTGREYWGVQYVEKLVREGITADARLVASMTELAAQSIYRAYTDFIFPRFDVSAIYLSGGGDRNPVLRTRLVNLFAPLPVRSSTDLGLPVDGKEAIAFAILANETICGHPSNVPGATGAEGPRVLGVICPGGIRG
jgi:anhydro-N-acetylmuramic acid kinase